MTGSARRLVASEGVRHWVEPSRIPGRHETRADGQTLIFLPKTCTASGSFPSWSLAQAPKNGETKDQLHEPRGGRERSIGVVGTALWDGEFRCDEL